MILADAQRRDFTDRHVPGAAIDNGRPITNQMRRLRGAWRDDAKSDLAEKIGMTRQTIAAIEAGKYSPSLEAAFRIAHVFNVEITGKSSSG